MTLVDLKIKKQINRRTMTREEVDAWYNNFSQKRYRQTEAEKQRENKVLNESHRINKKVIF
jgi:hypothetical protein